MSPNTRRAERRAFLRIGLGAALWIVTAIVMTTIVVVGASR